MKKIFTNLFYLFVIITIISISISSCKEDTDCKVEILTKLYSDTNMIVPYAAIWLHQKDIDVKGTANALGVFTHTFPLEAILNVTSSDTTVTPFLTGEGTIRLEPGKTVRKTIFVK